MCPRILAAVAVAVVMVAASAAADDRYAPPETCAGCHAAIASSYRGVSMSYSVEPMTPDRVIADFTRNNTFFHPESKRYYRMTQRNGRFFQRRWQLDAAGKEVHVFERQITHFIGSGRHARSYLYLAPSGELTQLPATWYTQEGRWAISPGYDSARHYDFSRVVDYACLFCHAAYPNLPAGADGFGRRALWPSGGLPESIDCQRCHGPGLRHTQLAGARADATEVRAAIVNPKKLSPQRAMDICLQCHLQTTSEPLPHALRRFGRGVFSFRPGEPASAYLVHFDHAPEAGREDKFEINGQGYRLLQSACYQKSAGKLTCTTCHDPHHAAQGHDARASYNEKCLSCHSPHTEAARQDCVSCHMPRRRTEDAVRVVMTDHRIQRGSAMRDLLAPLEEHHETYRGPMVLIHSPNLSPSERRLYLAAARCQSQSVGCEELAGSNAIEARLLLARSKASLPLYRQILAEAPGFSTARAEYASLLAQAGERQQAMTEFRAAARAPDSPPAAHLGLARLLIAAGDSQHSIEPLRQAASSVAARSEALNNLGNLLASLNRLDEAGDEIRAALSFEPDLAEGHNNLARVYALQGQLEQAEASARRAVELDGGYAEAHYNLGRLLHARGDREGAVVSYRNALRCNPALPEAHFSLGVALAESQQFAAAAVEFRETLRLNPGHAEARQNLETIARLQRSAP